MIGDKNRKGTLDLSHTFTDSADRSQEQPSQPSIASLTRATLNNISSTSTFTPRFPPHPALQDLLARNRPTGPGDLPQDPARTQATSEQLHYFSLPRDQTTDSTVQLDGASEPQLYTDEHDNTASHEQRGSLPMTTARVATMAAKPFEHTTPRRPPLTSQQSSSVPSTPNQHPYEFRSKSRSPSPHRGLGAASSSRFAVADTSRPMAALPKGRPTCKYEIGAAFSRRRMQYDIGDAPLEKPKEEPKKSLNPQEEKKISGDMRVLYDRLLPSAESERSRRQFVQKLERILHKEWPGNEFQVNVFGSSGNMLCTSESDVDICIQTPMTKLASMHMLAEVLANNGMEKVICVAAAKVPIVKVWDPELKLAADVNVNNSLALENTRMIKTYIQLDERVRPLAMVVKHWTRQRILNDAGIGGTLSSYAWICLIINFLQTREPPILPSLHLQPHAEYMANDGTESGFSDDVPKFANFGTRNKETIGELLFHFFRRYTYELDFESSVISVRNGRLLTRKEKGWDHTSKEGQWRLCIEEPFNISRNLGNSADSTAFRGLQLEMQRAFELLADDGQLEKCCEAYQFPAEEKTFFKKPTPGNKSIPLTAPGQSNRNSRLGLGSGSLRGGRSNTNTKGSGPSYRRASGGATFGRMNNMSASLPFLQNPMMAPTPELGQFGFDPYNFYLGQGRDAAFREQFYANHAATLQAQSVARAHANAVVQAGGSPRDGSTAASPQKTPYMAGSPQLEDMQQSAMPFDGARTNPSSPSMTASTPVRRGFQRTSMSSGSQNGTVRSQSQPARGMANGQGFPILTYDPNGRPYYTNMVPQDLQQGQRMSEAPLRYNPALPVGPLFMNGGAPKEYVGYFVKDTTNMQAQPQFQNGPIPQIPSFKELRQNRASQDLQPPLANGSRRASRSPSPLGHMRTLSTPLSAPLRSAPLPSQPPTSYGSQEMAQPVSEYPRQTGGLLIINGSGSGFHGSLPESEYTSSSHSREKDFSDNTDYSENRLEQAYSAPLLSGPFNPDARSFYGNGLSLGMPEDDVYAHQHINGGRPESELSRDNAYEEKVQPFPPFVPSAAPSSTSTAVDEDAPLSPKTARPNNWRSSFDEVKSKRQIDSPPSVIETPKQAEPRHGPLLSPVIETRTPSPTVQRRTSLLAKQVGEGAPSSQSNGVHGKENGRFGSHGKASAAAAKRLSNVPVPPTPAPAMEATLSSSSAESPVQQRASHAEQLSPENSAGKNIWEVKTKKKKSGSRQKKKAGGGQSRTDNAAGGEPLPTRGVERKGG